MSEDTKRTGLELTLDSGASNISAACRGKQKSCGGYTWKFVV